MFYEGEEGFDIKYSNTGMWGRGIYFAQNAKYSLDFAYKYKDSNVKGMFLALVNLGKVKDMEKD